MSRERFVEAVQGVNIEGPLRSTSKITKSAGAAWDAGAAALPRLAGDGFVEFTVDVTGKYRAIGLSSFGSPSLNYNTIDHGIYLKGGGTPTEFEIVENGPVAGAGTGTYAVGDTFRIQRDGTTITYWHNGEIHYTSIVAAAGERMIDVAIFDTATSAAGIRLYDKVNGAWQSLTWATNNCSANTIGGAFNPRRITFAAPAAARAGDRLVALIASQAADVITPPDATWSQLASLATTTKKRGLAVFGHAFDDADPASLVFDLAVTHCALGALLVYRGIAPTLVASGALNGPGTTHAPTPILAKLRPSDVYLAAGFLFTSTGLVMASPNPFAPERIDFESTVAGKTCRFHVHEITGPNLGNVRSTVASSSLPGGTTLDVFGLVLAGMPELGRELGFAPIVAGAIGLPSKGI